MSGVEIDAHDHGAWDAIVRQVQPDDPDGNLFLVALSPAGKYIGAIRFRMPAPPNPAMTIRIGQRTLQTLRRGDWSLAGRLVSVAYGPAILVGPVIAITAAAAAETGVEMYDIVRVYEGRAWSYLCPDEEHHAGGAGLVIDPLSDTAIQVVTVLELGRDQG